MKRLSKKSKKILKPEVYDSLDAPIYIWQKVHETTDMSWLLVKRKKVSKAIAEYIENAWNKIYDEYINEFGLSEQFIYLKEKEVELALLRLEYIITGNRKKLTAIYSLEEEVRELQEASNGKSNFQDLKIAIESKFKFQVNMHQTSIREFYSYLKHLK